MPASATPSIIEDSNGDDGDGDDYSYEADLVRHKTRQAAFKIELEIHSRNMSARRPRRKLRKHPTSPRQESSTLSLLSSSSLHESSGDESEDDILAFLQPKKQPGLSGLQIAAPKLTMADIREQVAKNKARDEEIQRARRLLEQNESNQKPVQPSSANLNSYLEAQDGAPALLNMLKPSNGKADQLPRWSFFGATTTAHQVPLDELCASFRASNSIAVSLGPDGRELGVEYIRDFLVSGAMMDFLGSNIPKLERPLRYLLLDAVCLRGDEDISFSCLTLITALHKQFESILDQKRILRIFKLIGGSDCALDLRKPLEMDSREAELDNVKQGLSYSPSWWNISLVLKMLTRLLQGLSDDQLQIVWGLVLRLSLDERRMKERNGQPELFGAMECLLEQLECRGNSLTQIVLSDIWTSVTDRALQVQFLGLLPITSGFSHDFRKRLARLFFSGNQVYLGLEPDPGILMSNIVTTLTSKEVRISKGESHTRVQNIVDIINIAVDDARWCVNIVERNEKGSSENLLDKLILRLKHSKEFIQEGSDMNIEKSNAKDSFAKLIMRLESIRQKRRGNQTVMEKYFRPNSGEILSISPS